MESTDITKSDYPRVCPEGVRPEIFTLEDIQRMVPPIKGFPFLAKELMRFLWLDKCNDVHSRYCYTTGISFANLLIEDAFRIQKRVDNEEVLDRFEGKPFITVSNHPLGALDGILLLDIIGRHRPDFKVMVNMFLNYLTAMRPSFIAVDAMGSSNEAKRTASMLGVRRTIAHVRDGHPVGFFPAGAVSKVDKTLHISDREWQPSLLRLIAQLKVPIVPVYFHQHNSTFFNILGMIDWRLRTLRLPRELFKKTGKEIHVSFGEPIMPEEQAKYKDVKELGLMLRQHTYVLKENK